MEQNEILQPANNSNGESTDECQISAASADCDPPVGTGDQAGNMEEVFIIEGGTEASETVEEIICDKDWQPQDQWLNAADMKAEVGSGSLENIMAMSSVDYPAVVHEEEVVGFPQQPLEDLSDIEVCDPALLLGLVHCTGTSTAAITYLSLSTTYA